MPRRKKSSDSSYSSSGDSRSPSPSSSLSSSPSSSSEKDEKNEKFVSDSDVSSVDLFCRTTDKRQRKLQQSISSEAKEAHGKGNAFVVKNDVPNAIFWFQKAIKLSPNFVEAYLSISSLYLDQQDFEKAAEMTMMASSIRVKDPELWKDAADQFYAIKSVDKALYCYKRAFYSAGVKRLKDNRPNALVADHLMTLVHALIENGKQDQATKYMERFYEGVNEIRGADFIDTSEFNKIYARCLFDCRKPQEARAVLLREFEISKNVNDMNLICEIDMHMRNWQICLENILGKDGNLSVSLDILRNLPIEFVVKILICFYYQIFEFEKNRGDPKEESGPLGKVLQRKIENLMDKVKICTDFLKIDVTAENDLEILEPLFDCLTELNKLDEIEALVDYFSNAVPRQGGSFTDFKGPEDLEGRKIRPSKGFEKLSLRFCYFKAFLFYKRNDFQGALKCLCEFAHFSLPKLNTRNDLCERAVALYVDLLRLTCTSDPNFDNLPVTVKIENVPKAYSVAERRKLFDSINKIFETLEKSENLNVNIVNKLTNLFFNLMNDCLLDSTRISSIRKLDGTKKASSRELHISSIESFFECVKDFVDWFLKIFSFLLDAKKDQLKSLLKLIEKVRRITLYKKVAGQAAVDDFLIEKFHEGALQSKEAKVKSFICKIFKNRISSCLDENIKIFDSENFEKNVDEFVKTIFAFAKEETLFFEGQNIRSVQEFKAYFKNLLKHNEGSFILNVALGYVNLYISNFRQAADHYRFAVEHQEETRKDADPSLLIYLISALSRFLISRKNFNKKETLKEILRNFEILRQLEGEDPVGKIRFFYNMARFFHGAGYLGEAVNFYKKTIEMILAFDGRELVKDLEIACALNLKSLLVKRGMRQLAEEYCQGLCI